MPKRQWDRRVWSQKDTWVRVAGLGIIFANMAVKAIGPDDVISQCTESGEKRNEDRTQRLPETLLFMGLL